MAIQATYLCPLVAVFDMPTSMRFYRDVLGFEIVEQSRPGEVFDWVWLRLGEAHLMLNTAYESEFRPPTPDAARIAAHEDTGLYISCPDVDGAYRHLVEHGIEAEPPKVAPYGMKQLYLRDPDGYNICFQWAAQPAEAEQTVAAD